MTAAQQFATDLENLEEIDPENFVEAIFNGFTFTAAKGDAGLQFPLMEAGYGTRIDSILLARCSQFPTEGHIPTANSLVTIGSDLFRVVSVTKPVDGVAFQFAIAQST